MNFTNDELEEMNRNEYLSDLQHALVQDVIEARKIVSQIREQLEHISFKLEMKEDSR